MRYERVSTELGKLREAGGLAGLPDFEAEEVLRDALAATEQQKLQVGIAGPAWPELRWRHAAAHAPALHGICEPVAWAHGRP